MLTREAILNAQRLKTDSIDVPEWGGVVNVRQLTALERFAFFDALDELSEGEDNKRKKDLNASGLFVCWTVVDEKGERLFQDSDLDALIASNAHVVERIATHAGKLNGIGSAEESAGN